VRISTTYLFRQGVAAIRQGQSALAKTQEQVASGHRITRPADDPAAAARLLGLDRTLASTRQYLGNADRAASRLALEDSTLDHVGNLLQRVRELAVQGNNDVLTGTDRQALAQELQQRLGELLGLANSRDGNGEFLFAGTATATEPFARAGAQFVYRGDQGARALEVSSGYRVAVGDPGSDVFQAIRNGNGTFSTAAKSTNTGDGVIGSGTVVGTFVPDTYTVRFTAPNAYTVEDGSGAAVTSGTFTSGNAIAFNGAQITITGSPAAGDTFTVASSVNQDLFTTVQNLATTLQSSGGNPADRGLFHSAMNRSLVDIDQAMAKVLSVRAGVGSRSNAIENQQAVGRDFEVQLQTTISAVRDVDMAQALSRLERERLTLEAAQRSFAAVQRLSLFNFL